MLNIGYILDNKYEILRVLGEGGMGTVYLCRNNRIGNLWAVKEVNIKKDHKIDFLAEPNILKHLFHEGIPRIVDIFYEKDYLYMVEDYIEGETLKDFIEKHGPLNSDILINMSMQLCSILAYLHSFNPPIIYRDLKPSNIMVKPNKKIVLIDFGIARTFKKEQDSDTLILGSRGYIAPEQLMNIQSNEQTDIYSLGATMYFMATGKTPALPTELVNEDNYPKSLDNTILKIIQKSISIEPQNRYKSIKELHASLQQYIKETSIDKTYIDYEKQQTEMDKKTILMNRKSKTNKSKSKHIVIILFFCFFAFSISTIIFLSKKGLKQMPAAAPINTSGSENTPAIKKEVSTPVESTEEKDITVRGILYKNNPIILGDNNNSKKGNKNKNYQTIFNLKPSSSISNSKYNIWISSIELLENNFIANINIENKTNNIIHIDLNKTYLVNERDNSLKLYNPSSVVLLPIPPNSKKENIKLYFRDFKFQGSSYTLKTSINSEKLMNFFIDIK